MFGRSNVFEVISMEYLIHIDISSDTYAKFILASS